MKKIALLVALCFTAEVLMAAPIPGRGNKVSPKLGIYKSPKGFQINLGGSEWIQQAPPKKTRNIATMFRSPHMKNNMRGTLTVRVDRLKKKMKLKSYVKRWTKQYPKFGFDVRGSRKFAINGQKGYVIDLVNQKKQRQLRQVVFMRGSKAVLLTCRDHVKSFKGTLKECNRMIKNFRWTASKKRRSKKA